MPPLLSPTVFDAPTSRPRWMMIAVAALLISAWTVNWQMWWDDTRGLGPASTEQHAWTGTDLATAPATDLTGTDLATAPATDLTGDVHDPATARSAQLTDGDLIIDLVWDAALTITAVRAETYTDPYGTGHRLGIAADTTTTAGTGCLHARLLTHEGQTTVQTCIRTDRHPNDTTRPDDTWRPDHLFLTRTANLDPANFLDPTLVDYYGFGTDLGNSNTTGIWGPNWTWPTMGDNYQACDDPTLVVTVADAHLTDHYDDTAAESAPMTAHTDPAPATPTPGGLRSPACTPLHDRGSTDPQTSHQAATEPFVSSLPTPLSQWQRYNTATTGPVPLHTAIVIDVRSCDTAPDRCTADAAITPASDNSGPGQDWVRELLDCAIAVDPCPGY